MSPTGEDVPRDELVAMIAKAHQGSYGESSVAGKTLAAQSKLPRLIAENLGAGFGQWDFFPEAADIVEFAYAYVPPANEEEMWSLARAWAADDAAAKQTILALVGREILQHELKRIDVEKLNALFSETRTSRANVLRAALGLAVPASSTPPIAPKPRAASPKRAPAAPRGEIPLKMPKPQFKKPVKPPPPPPPKRYQHPKFGEGTLEAQDGVGEEAKLTIKFEAGPKTLLAKYVIELPS